MSLRIAIVGCGQIAAKRAEALRAVDTLVGCYDTNPDAARRLAARHGGVACRTLEEMLSLAPQAVIVATSHDCLYSYARQALMAGAGVLVEKPAGISMAEIDSLIECQRICDRVVKVGFNHRFHPGLVRARAEVASGRHGPPMHLRARYGHGGRPGYEREWRADPIRAGGGELVDQGMHLIDLTNWLMGPLPLHCALLRTQFWEMEVEDNAALILGDASSREGPWAMLHVSWTEWKNMFSLELYCRNAKIQLDGLARSYGSQRLRVYRMRPGLGPPDLEEIEYPPEDISWREEWRYFAEAVESGGAGLPGGNLGDARYAWSVVEQAYSANARAGGVGTLDEERA